MAVVDVSQIVVRDNPAASQFEAYIGEQQVGIIGYDVDSDALLYIHTEVPEAYEGQGVAARLTEEAFHLTKAQGKRVVALCPYTQAFLRKHPEYRSFT